MVSLLIPQNIYSPIFFGKSMKKLIIATLGGFAAMFGLSGLWHELLAPKFYPPIPGMNTTPNLIFIGVGYLIFAGMMSYLYPLFTQKKSDFLTNLKFGVFMGILWTIPISLIFVGALNYPPLAAAYDSLWSLVEQGVGGIIIGFLYTKKF